MIYVYTIGIQSKFFICSFFQLFSKGQQQQKRHKIFPANVFVFFLVLLKRDKFIAYIWSDLNVMIQRNTLRAMLTPAYHFRHIKVKFDKHFSTIPLV